MYSNTVKSNGLVDRVIVFIHIRKKGDYTKGKGVIMSHGAHLLRSLLSKTLNRKFCGAVCTSGPEPTLKPHFLLTTKLNLPESPLPVRSEVLSSCNPNPTHIHRNTAKEQMLLTRGFSLLAGWRPFPLTSVLIPLM